MEGGSMHDFLYGPRESYQYPTARDWANQIAKGLAYLHDPSVGPIIHRDIKPHNILLSKERLIVKIGDFGNAKPLDNAMTCESGTVMYMAPEVYDSRNYTEKCDVYSFGITVWEMLAMQQPLNWYKKNFPLQLSVSRGERPSFGGPMKNCPKSMKELIESCWDQKPSNRPSMKSVIKELNDMIDSSGEH
ncbi:mitogen-activated protein kinase kinase kinase 7-like isoform X2 [Drosophila willistoni]|nr:mitogen-activated protein kinase kinase kinase 7-like isoform X2 [Drosophila willistoni]